MPKINGQFISRDQLGQQVPAPTGGVSGGTSNIAGGDAIRQIFFNLASADPKNASKYSTIAGLAEPSQLDKERIQAEEKEAKGLSQTMRDIQTLEEMYFKNNLAKGSVFGIGSEIGRLLNPGGAYDTYKDTLVSMGPTFARRSGDVGNLSKAEQKAARALFPSARLTRNEAETKFAAARKKFGLPEPDYDKLYPSVGGGSDWEIVR
jgi:hypothetical protein